jgi:hypothetical protein
MKQFIFAISVAILCQFAHAETCPSVNDIQHELLADWAAYDSDDGRPLSTKQTKKLTKSIAQFALAEWTGDEQHGEIHCHYRDIDGSQIEAYLGKKNYFPDNATKRWYQVSGHMHCAAGMDQCIFNNPQPQLATS